MPIGDDANEAYVDNVPVQKGLLRALWSQVQTHFLGTDNPHQTTAAQVGLGNVDDTSDADKPISTAQREAIDAVGGAVSSLEGALANILVASSEVAGQASDFAALSSSGTYNAETYAVSAPSGVLTALSVYSAGGSDVTGNVCVFSVSGNDLTVLSSFPVVIVPGFNRFVVDLPIPQGAAIGIQTDGARLYVGTNSGLASVPLWYSVTNTNPVTASTLTGAVMLSGEVESRTETISGTVQALSEFLQTETTRLIAGVEMAGDETTTTGTGQNLMVMPDQVVTATGRITSVEVVQPATSTGTRYLLVFDYDGVDTYTRVGRHPLTLVAGYNLVEVDIPVTAGQVLGLGGNIGTDAEQVGAHRTIFSNSGTVLVDGVDPSGNYNWFLNANMTREVLVAQSQAAPNARKTARIIYGHGQSNMVGQNSAPLSGSAYGNLMFSSGLRTLYDPGARTSLASLAENGTTSGLSLAAAYCTELEMAAAGAATWQELSSVFFAATGALGGISVETAFDYNGAVWPNALDDLRAAGSLLRNEGYDPLAAFFVWVQGASNRGDARGEYAPKLIAGFEQARGAMANAGGSPFLIAAQMPHHQQSDDTNLPNAALDTRDAAIALGGEVFPLYPAEWEDGGIHMSTQGNVYKGLMIGKMMFDIANGGHQHVRFRVDTWGASSVVLDILGGSGSYAFDTTAIPAVPNMGFDAFDAGGALLSGVVTGASLSGTQVTLSLSRALVSGERITYGFGRPGITIPTDAAPGPYALGNLRDTDARTARVAGVDYDLWNWAAIQEVVR